MVIIFFYRREEWYTWLKGFFYLVLGSDISLLGVLSASVYINYTERKSGCSRGERRERGKGKGGGWGGG